MKKRKKSVIKSALSDAVSDPETIESALEIGCTMIQAIMDATASSASDVAATAVDVATTLLEQD